MFYLRNQIDKISFGKVMDRFSELIHSRHEQVGLSLCDLGEGLKEEGSGLYKNFLIFLEKERKEPAFSIAYALSRALDIDSEKASRAVYRERANLERKRERDGLVKFIYESNISAPDAENMLK